MVSFFSQRSTQIGIYFGSLLLFVIASLIGLAKKAFGKSIKLTLIIQLIIIIAVAFVLIILAERAPNWDFGLPVEIRFIQTSVKVFTVLTIISIVLLLLKLRKKEITAKTGLLHGFLFISSACQIGWFWNWWNITIL